MAVTDGGRGLTGPWIEEQESVRERARYAEARRGGGGAGVCVRTMIS